MLPSVLAAQLRQGIEDYLRTTFPTTNQVFEKAFDNLFADSDAMFKGPYVSLKLPFQSGKQETTYFPEVVPAWFKPHHHQEESFARIGAATPISTIVATGTGSGKTECFLFPILDYCWRHRGEPGIKAIIIYPMNALATDQANFPHFRNEISRQEPGPSL